MDSQPRLLHNIIQKQSMCIFVSPKGYTCIYIITKHTRTFDSSLVALVSSVPCLFICQPDATEYGCQCSLQYRHIVIILCVPSLVPRDLRGNSNRVIVCVCGQYLINSPLFGKHHFSLALYECTGYRASA